MRASARGVLRIGSLRVDPTVDEIEHDGRIIKLEPKAMRVLMCLAAHAGEVVSIEQLLEAVWEDVIVTPDSVYHAVAGLRRVLGDDPKNPTYIANVVRRGYRLVAPVMPWIEPLMAAPSSPGLLPGDMAGMSEEPAGAVAAKPAAGDAADAAAACVPGPLATAAGSKPAAPVGNTDTPAGPSRKFRLVLAVASILAAAIIVTWQAWRPAGGNATRASSVIVQDSSVAVLPFRDESQNNDQEFFADGLTEEIIDLLAAVPALRVPGRTSSSYFKGKSTDVREIAKILGVANVLEGSVRRSGDELRITATLVRAENGYQIWSQTYDLLEANIFAIQDDIAAAVVRNLKAIIYPPKPRRFAPAVNLEAYTAVLRARFLLNRESDKDNRDAIAVLQRAIEIDPRFAAAWAELARAHRDRGSYFDETPDGDMNLARSEAQKALALDPNCVEAHEVLAEIRLIYDFDPEGASTENEAIKAADSGRHRQDAYSFYTGCVIGSCYEQVIRDTDEEIASDPLNPGPYSTQALALYLFGDLARAERDVRHAIALSPHSGHRYYLLVRILLARHDLVHLLETTKVLPDSLYSRASLALAYHALGDGPDEERALHDLLAHDSKEGAYQIAEVYAARGQFGDTMAWLEQAYALHDAGLWILQVDPLLRPLAGTPRFAALKRKLHM
ncbi:MAG: winged helix-turn-helix domain-containing protein [Pseudomonadota bacterium]|nr:winged helix-turn-helix domain-containing protein [Pseudomonadota bacterium]